MRFGPPGGWLTVYTLLYIAAGAYVCYLGLRDERPVFVGYGATLAAVMAGIWLNIRAFKWIAIALLATVLVIAVPMSLVAGTFSMAKAAGLILAILTIIELWTWDPQE